MPCNNCGDGGSSYYHTAGLYSCEVRNCDCKTCGHVDVIGCKSQICILKECRDKIAGSFSHSVSNGQLLGRLMLAVVEEIESLRENDEGGKYTAFCRFPLSDEDIANVEIILADLTTSAYAITFCDDCEKYHTQGGECSRCDNCSACHGECANCGRCSDCCECPYCEGCSNTVNVSSWHNRCDRCESCCQCVTCERCTEYIDEDDQCGGCSRCESCCNCSSCHAIRGSGRTMKEAGKRLAGLEVEFTECADFTHIAAWAEQWHASVHVDGSCGWEAVTAPASGVHLQRQVSSLTSALSNAEAEVADSCGVHVHVDARDLKLHHIRNLAAIYAKVEPVLYILGGQSRVSNREFCAPNGDKLLEGANASNWREGLFSAAMPGRRIKQWRANGIQKKAGSRYVGLNMVPWFSGKVRQASDTTIEFRLHEGCHDGERLYNWASLCVALVDAAVAIKWSEVQALPKDAARALMALSSEHASWIAMRIFDWSANVHRLYRTVTYDSKNGWRIAA
jgi:hypothetical protein